MYRCLCGCFGYSGCRHLYTIMWIFTSQQRGQNSNYNTLNKQLLSSQFQAQRLHQIDNLTISSLCDRTMTIREQLQRMAANTNRGIRFIDELNACIEMKVYANGNEEEECAVELLKEHLRTFNILRMDVSERNYRIIKNLQKKYGVA